MLGQALNGAGAGGQRLHAEADEGNLQPGGGGADKGRRAPAVREAGGRLSRVYGAAAGEAVRA